MEKEWKKNGMERKENGKEGKEENAPPETQIQKGGQIEEGKEGLG